MVVLVVVATAMPSSTAKTVEVSLEVVPGGELAEVEADSTPTVNVRSQSPPPTKRRGNKGFPVANVLGCMVCFALMMTVMVQQTQLSYINLPRQQAIL